MSNKKYASLTTLQTFLDNLKNLFATKTEVSAKADFSHDHNDLYYTETEIDSKLSGKADSTHTHSISNITNLQSSLDAKVPTSRTVNGKALTGNISLSASDVGAAASSHAHDDKYYTETEIDSKLSAINTNITNITNGSTAVKEAEHAESADEAAHATSADSANSATSATKATQDASGNVITSTYETKSDASAKLTEAKEYTDTNITDLSEGFSNVIYQMYGTDLTENGAPTIRQIANNEANIVASGKADASHNHDEYYDAKGSADAALNSAKGYTDTKVSGLASTTVVDNKISTHNTSTSAHNDIRELITGLTTRLNTLANSDDTTLDQMSEVVAYIKNNKSLIDGITTSKINVSDIVNNLTTNSTSKVLSAAQGVAIKALIDTLQEELDSHTHAIADVSGLQSALDGKAASSHGTHVTYSTTAPVMDGTASVGSAATVARSDHKHPTDTSRASKTEFDTHTSNTTAHITSTERTNWNAAKTHADSAHAPSNAEKNQNAFSNVKVGSTTVAADTVTDTIEFAGSNVTITPDATNDKITFTVADGTTSAKGVVQLINSTSSTSTTTAATPSSVKSAYDLANTAKTNAATAQSKADSAYTLAEGKVDSLSDLGITATAAELNYMDGVTSNVQTQLDGKADSGHTHNYAGSSSAGGAATSANKVNSSLTVKLNGGTTESTNMFTFNGSAAKSVNITPASIGAQPAGSYAASSHTHDDRYYTETEIDTKLSGKANSSHGNHVPATQTASNKVFLRNDNTWATVTPANIGAAASSHTHTVANITDLTATAAELNYMDGVTSNVQTQLDGKASSSHTHTIANVSGLQDALDDKADNIAATTSTDGLMPAYIMQRLCYGGDEIVTTSGTGAAYTAVLDTTAIKVGSSFIMVPHTVSTTTAPTLNVNSLGAKTIRRMVSNSSTSTAAGYNSGWLAANKPVRVVYNGTYWIVTDLTKPSAADMSGTLGVKNGGTGKTSVTAGNFLVGNGTSAMTEKTPAEVLTALGITATATELNYMDGVVANVQTQIDAISSEVAAINRDSIIAEVIDAIGTPVFGMVDADNNIILTGDLVDGAYTLKYEDADGSTTIIGTLTVDSDSDGYTNLADSTSADWLTNKRINSSGSVVEVTTSQRGDDTVVITNFIDIQNVQKLHIKGLDVLSSLSSGQNYGRFYVYDSNKSLLVKAAQPSTTSYVTVADYDSSVWIIDTVGYLGEWGYSDERYVRLGGILTGAASDVVITADEPIV